MLLFFYEPEASTALGFGFRCGFLGLLHMEIIQERLEREFDLSLITTAPGVRHRVTQTNGQIIDIDNPVRFPEAHTIARIEEPMIKALIMTSDQYIGPILKLLEERRSTQKGFDYLASRRVLLTYENASQRDRPRFLRPIEVRLSRLRVVRLRAGGFPRLGHGQARRHGRRRTGGRTFLDRSRGIQLMRGARPWLRR